MKFIRAIALSLTVFLALTLLSAAPAQAEEILYSIGVDLTNQIVTVYTVEEGDIVRQMICSSGAKESPTRTGTFTMPTRRRKGERETWYHFYEGTYAHYATRIHEGYMFHSYLYYRADESRVSPDTVAYLGVPVSHGCMRMRPDDAEWIAKNCPAGTKVKIYYDDERDEYLRAILKEKSFFVEDGVPYSEFAGGAAHDGELGYGSAGEQVRALQNRMLGLGLYSGAANGRYGADMVKTVSTLQEALGLNVDGKVNKGLWELLFSDEAPTCDLSSVSAGANGPMVSYIQALLKKAALYDGEISGSFDANTDAAVRRYQNYAGVDVDGVLTKDQQAALAELIADLQLRFETGYELKGWSESIEMATINTRIRLNMRQSPSKEAAAVGQLKPNTVVRVLERGDEWSLVEYEGQQGYVMTEYIGVYSQSVSRYDFVAADDPELVAFDETQYEFAPFLSTVDVVIGTGKKASVMTFRKQKDAKARVAFGLLEKSSIELEAEEDGWVRATYCGVTGYIPKSELTISTERRLGTGAQDEGATLMARNMGDEEIPIYANVSLDSDVVDALQPGGKAEVLKQGDTWSQIVCGDGVGYVVNESVQIGILSERMQAYVASVSHYLSATGSIEGATVSRAGREMAAAIARDEVIPEVNLDAADADFIGDYDGEAPEFVDAFSAGESSGGVEPIDTSAAQEFFDAADAENPLGRSEP